MAGNFEEGEFSLPNSVSWEFYEHLIQRWLLQSCVCVAYRMNVC